MIEKIRRFNNFLIPRIIDKVSFHNKAFDINDTIIISGAPRSGTTWLYEILANLPNYTGVYEPLLYDWFPEAEKVGFNQRQYLIPTHDDIKKYNYLLNVFRGKYFTIRPEYKLSFNYIYRRLISKKLLIKFVRANRLLPWMVNNYNVKSFILLVRHPCSTIVSQIKSTYTGYWNPSIPNKKQILMELENYQIDENIDNLINSLRYEEEYLAFYLGMDYKIALSSEIVNNLDILCFESMVQSGSKSLNKFLAKYEFEIVNLKEIMQIRSQRVVTKTRKNWEAYLGRDRISRIRRILSAFDIQFDANSYWINGRKYFDI
jgi:hypothetical protein